MQSHEAFRKRLPFETVPTNLPGVFASVGPPEGFDPNTASSTELIKRGLLWRRPQKSGHHRLVAAWDKVFSRRWRAKDRIVPHLKPQIGKTHRLGGLKRTDAGFITNTWAGGVIQFGQWVTALGFWQVPTVSQPTEPQGNEGGWNSSSWIGIDGVNSNDVLQAGVEQQVDGSGNASYVAWFEWFAPGSVGGTINDISNNKVILGDTSPLSPTLASFNGNLYLAWKGDGNDNLSVMVSTDSGQSFGNKFISPETSPESPGLAVNNGELFITWKGDGNDNLNVAVVDVDLSTGNPTGFSNKVTLGDTSPLSPTLASLNGYLFLSWKGDGNDNLSVMVSTDNGQTFGNKFISPETSPESPALALHNGNLFIAWKGDGNDNLSVSLVNLSGFSTPPYVSQTNIANFPVNPGDTVYCSAQYINNNTAGNLYFANDTTGQHFSVALVPPPGASFNGNCIEWIMEAPDGGYPTSSLPSFTPVNFTVALGCGADGQTVGDPQNGDFFNISNGTTTLTSVTLGSAAVTVNFTG